MNRMITSGNQTVDEMASVNITGNVIPNTWYSTILKESGKPYLLAITILSDIVYWYRPREVRDEQTGYTIGLEKRFKGDFLQKSYSAYADMYGEGKRTVKRAFDTLVELKVIRRIFRDVQKGETTFYNTMFIDLDLQRLLELTYPDQYPSVIPYVDKRKEKDQEQCNGEDLDANAVPAESIDSAPPDKTVTIPLTEPSYPPAKLVRTPVTELSPPPDKTVRTPVTNLSPPPDKSGRYTKNTTENTVETTTETTFSEMDGMESINPSIPETDETIKQMQADIASIRENIGYDWEMAHGDYRTRRRFQEMFNLMCDVICINEAYVNLGGARVPYFRVREKLLQITREHLVYVMDCMDKNSGSIGNIQAYTLKSIYNAPSSIDSYYAHEANHDLNYMG